MDLKFVWVQTFLASHCLSDWGPHYSQNSLSSFLHARQGPHSLKLLQAKWEETSGVQQIRLNRHESAFQSPHNRARKALLVKRQASDLALNSTFSISYSLWNIRWSFLRVCGASVWGTFRIVFISYYEKFWTFINTEYIVSLCLRSGPLETASEEAVWVQTVFWGELSGWDAARVKEVAGPGERWAVRRCQQQP